MLQNVKYRNFFLFSLRFLSILFFLYQINPAAAAAASSPNLYNSFCSSETLHIVYMMCVYYTYNIIYVQNGYLVTGYIGGIQLLKTIITLRATACVTYRTRQSGLYLGA